MVILATLFKLLTEGNKKNETIMNVWDTLDELNER